jgi:hypothetical protein
MQLPLAGAEAEPEPTNTPAAIKAATDAENRAYRITPPLKWDRSLRFANRFVKPYLATLFKSARSRTTTPVADRLLPRVMSRFGGKATTTSTLSPVDETFRYFAAAGRSVRRRRVRDALLLEQT